MKKGQHIFGTVKVGEKGQIVIPKEARRIFGIKPGDTLLVLGDEAQGLAVVKADVMQELAVNILDVYKRQAPARPAFPAAQPEPPYPQQGRQH